MSGNAFGSLDPIYLFSLLDHYDESQMPDDGSLEPDTFDRFWIYISKPIALAGGCNPKKDNGLNDCLYNCLKMAYGTKWKLPQNIKTPELLKRRLNLQRGDPVPVQLIKEVETTSSICINVTGDHYYHSNQKFRRTIQLILTNGHYSLARNSERKKAQWFSKPGVIVVFRENYTTYEADLYDSGHHWTEPLAQFKEKMYKSPKYCFISV